MNAQHSITATALAALLVPFFEHRFGWKLSDNDVTTLVAVALGICHVASIAFNRWVAPWLDKRFGAASTPTPA